jgi:uncharacterized protein YbjT (DUF2867 family)
VRILVTGASGAIGGALAPALARAGHEVTAFARDPARVACQGVERIVQGDALTGAGLGEALAGAEVAYYLIHSMEPARGGGAAGFPQRERASAESFATACERAGVRRVVYLGGLVPAGRVPSEHLASRLAVEELLLGCAPEAVALRASIVISAASRSFRFLVRLVERTPVLPLPSWREHRTQPIDGRDVTAYLLAAGTSPAVDGPVSVDIAGDDVVSYGELVQRIRDALLLGRPELRLPCSLTPVASAVAAAISGEEIELVEPLMLGLTGDLLPRDARAHELFAVRLHRLDAAIERALRDWEAVEELAAR